MLQRFISLILVIVLSVLSFGLAPFASNVYAASLTGLSDTLSSSKINTLSSHTIRFTTPTGAADSTDTIIVTFPSDFNFTGKTIATVTFTHGATTGAESTEVLAASPTASSWGAVFSGTQNRILTLTAPTDGIGAATVAASDKMIITYSSANSTNATTNANYAVVISGTFGDTGTITVPILADDQVAVSATVTQSINFSISDNTIGFGNLSSSVATYATGDTLGSASEVGAHNVVAGTNANSGYTVTVKGATLTSGANTITAIGASNTASAATTEQFGLRLSPSGGSGAVTAPYAAAGFAYAADATTVSQVASATVPSADTTYSVRYIANVSSLTEAGSYTAALTYTATANY